MPKDYHIIYFTCENREEAEEIAKNLLQEKLVACVNIIPDVSSLYWWKGKIEKSSEYICFAKTNSKNLKQAKQTIINNHSYECPCVVAMDAADGNKEFLKWIDLSLEKD